jgi:formylglycine-generating enzyme required for sulfatase activity
MGSGSMSRFAWVLAVSGLVGVVASARGMHHAVEPAETVAELLQFAGEPPMPVAKTPKSSAERSRRAAKRPKRMTNSIGMNFVLVPAGEFQMGTPPWDKDGETDEKPQHRVHITSPFFLGTYEVTQQEYERVMGVNPSSEKLSPQQPVEMVSWFDTVQFCNRMSTRENLRPYYEVLGERVTILGGDGYRLPTEAEWEYACRAGSTTKWSCGDDVQQLEIYAWYQGNAGSHSHPVGEKAPNAFGLYDMHGHMWEWCWDWYGKDYYRQSPADDPQGPTAGTLRIERGGDGWNSEPPRLRSAYRNHQVPSLRFRDLGFRVARTSSEAPPAQSAAKGGKDDSPTEILKKRGLVCLRGTPPTWIIKEETDVLARCRLVGYQEAWLAWAHEQQKEVLHGTLSRQALIDVCQAGLDSLDREFPVIDQKIGENPFIGTGMAAYYHNLLVQMHNKMVGEESSLRAFMKSLDQQRRSFEEELRQFGEEVEKMDKSHQKTFDELRDWIADINRRYDDLGADKEIAKALSEVSATTPLKPKLGPSRALKNATKAVARAGASKPDDAPAGRRRKKR